MSILQLRSFFGWCTIFNFAWLLYVSLMIRFADGWLWHLSNWWIELSKENFHLSLYLLIGAFKILFIAFNLVPYVALVILSRKKY